MAFVTTANARTQSVSENDVHRRGKAMQSQVPSNTTRQALGAINRVEGSLATRAQVKFDVPSNPFLHKEKVQEVNKEVDPCMPGSYDPIAVIEAPELPDNIADIDIEDSDNPLLYSEYIKEIYVYLRRIERQQAVRKDYMSGYSITPRMRLILIDWLVQVHQRFHLMQETLYLTVAIIDRFLQDEEVSKNKLQLVGVTAMWIASKYEEMYAPEIGDFVYITDNSYTKANIRQMERIMLKRLKFDLGRPLPLHFLRRYSKAGQVDSMRHSLAKYLLELSLIDYHLVHYHPSEISAACLCMSMKLLEDQDDTLGGTPNKQIDDDNSQWDDTMVFYSTYSLTHLQPIMDRLALLVYKSPSSKQKAIRVKYQASKYMKMSKLEELQSPFIAVWAQRAADAP